MHFRQPAHRIAHSGCDVQGIQLQDGREEHFDQVISTMPLSLLVRGLKDVPTEVSTAVDSLRFHNKVLVYLHVDSDALFDNQWLYIHAPELKIGRYEAFQYANQDHSILMGILAAEKCLGIHSHDQWNIDANQQNTYQEAALITIGENPTNPRSSASYSSSRAAAKKA